VISHASYPAYFFCLLDLPDAPGTTRTCDLLVRSLFRPSPCAPMGFETPCDLLILAGLVAAFSPPVRPVPLFKGERLRKRERARQRAYSFISRSLMEPISRRHFKKR
jgi:hypothetical protein